MKRKTLTTSVLLAVALGTSAAALAAIPVPSDNREASFMPPPVALTQDAQAAPKPEEPKVIAPAPVEAPKVEAPKVEAPKVEVPKVEEKVSVVPPDDKIPAPVPVPDKMAPIDLGTPVAEAKLPDIDPQSVGLLMPDKGGLGGTLWQGTPRALAERFLFTTSLPTNSPVLNDLAYRMLASIAAMPEDEGNDAKDRRTFTALRVEKLVSLGRVDEAWKLAGLVKPDTIDDMTLRLLTEATLMGPDKGPICDKIPSLIAAHAKAGEGAIEWQKSLLVCQLRTDNMKAVQLGYDMLREQKAQDDIFLTLISKNVMAGSKQLPRHLTPLRPINLAVLRYLDMPLPSEVYAHPEASMIPELVKARAFDEKARLGLAERAATSGLLSPEQLAQAYQTVSVTQGDASEASADLSVHGRALIYLALVKAQDPAHKIQMAQRFLSGLDEVALTGAIGQLIAGALADIPASETHREFAPQGARLYALTGDMEKAKAWLDVAQKLAPRFAEVGTHLASHWPLFVLSGMIDAKDYEQGFKDWLSVALTPDQAAGKEKQRRAVAGDTLMLLAAAGNKIPEEAWVRVMDAGVTSKQMMPAPILLERLGVAAQEGRRGETVMLALSLADSSAGDPPVLVSTEIVRALRTAGLSTEAKAYAREAVTRLVIP